MTTIQIPVEKWNGTVREVTLGADTTAGGTRTKTVTLGGEKTLPYLHFEVSPPHPPAIALEIQDRHPADWSPILLEAWGDVTKDVTVWAKAAEEQGVDLLQLKFTPGNDLTADYARRTVRRVLESTGLPLIVFGPGQANLDNDILVAVAEEAEGERLLLGVCEEKNYRTIVAAALAHGHLVDARCPMDVNLSKQLNILISDMGLPLDRIVMDPTTGALGYGIEYGYSVMERLRLAALQGDNMTQMPMLVTPGEEVWRTKEARTNDGVPTGWGDWQERAVNWEILTTTTLLHSGANIVVLRHPESVSRIRTMIQGLMTTTNN
jgi:acetyl-CoA decarbonylase/synthase complex subunit delta